MSQQIPGHQPVRRVRIAQPQRYDRLGRPPQRPPGPESGLRPYFIGSLVSASVLTLAILVWLIISPSASPSARPVTLQRPDTTAPGQVGNNNANPGEVPTQPQAVVTGLPGEVSTRDPAQVPPVPTGSPPPVGDPPRITLSELKKLNDSSSIRPIILDVRPKASYDAGHITGATSFPEADVDTLIKGLPKDKAIVAYCACPAEETSVRVAKKLKDQYGFSYQYVNVLLGGWDLWQTKSHQDPTGYPVVGGDQ